MKKIIPFVVLGLLVAFNVSAHVIVKPSSIGIGATQVFTMGVPTEMNTPTVAIRLMLPDGLQFVTPNAKPGWKIAIKTTATGKKITDDDGMQVDEMKPTEIDWTGGSIPVGQRDEFEFQAQAPATATILPWKAYQTYQDGTVVSWDETPSSTAKNPYSVTNVINDLSPVTNKISWWQTNQVNLTLIMSLLALVISLGILIKHKQ